MKVKEVGKFKFHLAIPHTLKHWPVLTQNPISLAIYTYIYIDVEGW